MLERFKFVDFGFAAADPSFRLAWRTASSSGYKENCLDSCRKTLGNSECQTNEEVVSFHHAGNYLSVCVEWDWPSSRTFHSSEQKHRVYSVPLQR